MAVEKYIVKEDTVVTLEDERQLQYKAGAEIPMSEAISVGLVKKSAKPGPAETKDEEPTATRAAPRKK